MSPYMRRFTTRTAAALGAITLLGVLIAPAVALPTALPSDLIVAMDPTAVLTLGDNQYPAGQLSEFMGEGAFDDTWGRFKNKIRPAFGDEDHADSGVGNTGYYTYFNGAGNANGPAGPTGKGYYSFDVGTWHIVVLNS